MRIALAHDYLTQRGGAERVVLSLCRAFPDATIHTALFDPEGTFPEFRDRRIATLWLDRITPLRHHHRLALPLLPIAWSSGSVEANVTLCSSSGWAHGIKTSGRKIVYCHSPAKWLYRTDDYLGDHPSEAARLTLRMLSPGLRRFDRRAAETADRYLVNSSYIAAEVERVYGISATVVPPPAGVDLTGEAEPVAGIEPGYFLTVARLLPYKNVAPTIEAFRGLDARLVVVGDGPQRQELATETPKNVNLLGEIDDRRLRWLYANCAGLVAASREDFGLTPVEAGSFGKPVAALRWGGFLDTIMPGQTGTFFDTAEPAAIAEAVTELERTTWDKAAIETHAATFGEARFVERIRAIVAEVASLRGMSSYESIGARIAVEQATLVAVRLFKNSGIESIVLKGPALAAVLYESPEERVSIDVDLLVEDIAPASEVLQEAGYSRIVDWTPGMDRHAWTHKKENAVSIDLHRTLVGIGASPLLTWQVLNRESSDTKLAGGGARAPGSAAQAMVVALHAAQHGRASEKTLEDLRRAVAHFDFAVWEHAGALSRELAALEAFAGGLALDTQGRLLAKKLGVAGASSRIVRLRTNSSQPTALGIDRLLVLPPRQRPKFLARKLFPPADFMRDWRPIARRGRSGLAAAYIYRAGWLVTQAPGGLRAVRAGNREPGNDRRQG